MRSNFLWLSVIIILVAADSLAEEGKGGCIRTGCSGELCSSSSANQAGQATICRYTNEDACLRIFAICERQWYGFCDFTKQPEFTDCLKNPKKYLEQDYDH